MLMMSRRAGESILIGEEIEILIAHVGRKKVRVGIRAPRSLRVVGRELRLVEEENRAASEAGQPAAGVPDLLARLRAVQVSTDRTDEDDNRQEAGNKN